MQHPDRDEETYDLGSIIATLDQVGVPARGTPNALEKCGRYILGTRLGVGGMGEVFAAVDVQIGREVAIKRLRHDRPTERALDRFFREACVQGRLDHPAIVPVHELGVDADGRPFFTMKKLAGTTLAKRIAEGGARLDLLRAFADVCLAIEYAHERGVVHRDLKPSNIVLGDFREVYVIDWGIAKVIGDDASDDDSFAGRVPTTLDNTESSALGTPGYMAPEQMRGAADADNRDDVYSLGCMLFEILAGEPLHPRGKAACASTLQGCDARPSMRSPSQQVPPELDALCVAATAQDRDARIPTARELGARVQRYLDGDRDLELRNTLAHTHLAAARAAFDRLVESNGADETELRRTAVREAARALALDPTLDDAAELVGRLMLAPPRSLPPDVERSVADAEQRSLRSQTSAGAQNYLFYIVLLPMLIGGGLAALPYHLALFAAGGLTLALLVHPRTRGKPVAQMVGNFLLLCVVSQAFSPLFLAPMLAAMCAMALIVTPTFSRRAAIVGTLTFLAAIFVPWLAELAGILPQTIDVTADSIVLTGPVLTMPVWIKVPTIILLFAASLGATATFAHSLRRNDRAVREHLHLQTWQLRQLVPTKRG